jgi:hypothetical protein
LLDHLREVAQGRDDIRVECAGVMAGSWFAGIGKRGEDLIAAGLLMLAGYVDLAELNKWVRVGWERRRGATEPYPDSETQTRRSTATAGARAPQIASGLSA